MPVTIKLKNSTSPGSTPSSLENGELALAIPGGALFYQTPAEGIKMLAQRIGIGSNVSEVVDPQTGMLYFEQGTNRLHVCTNGGSASWETVGIPDENLTTLNAPLVISGGGTSYLRTMDESAFDHDGNLNGDYVELVRLKVLNETWLAGSLHGTDASLTGAVTIGGKLTVNNTMQVSGDITRQGRGSHPHWSYSHYTGGRIRTMASRDFPPPEDNADELGDIYLGY